MPSYKEEKAFACPECSGIAFASDHKSGDEICVGCGTVVASRIIDPTPEWRDFSDSDKDASRIGRANPFVSDLSTTIGPINGQTVKMAKWQARMVNNPDRNMLNALEQIDHFASSLGLNERIKNRAKEIYKEFEEKRTKATRYKKEPIIVGVLIRACKEENVPRSFKEVSRATRLPEKDIRREYKTLTGLLGSPAIRTSAPDLISRFCSNLKLPFHIEQDAIAVATKASEIVEGKSPCSIAAASILIVTNLSTIKRHERDIAEAASISPTTIRNVYKELLPFQDKFLPPHYTRRLNDH